MAKSFIEQEYEKKKNSCLKVSSSNWSHKTLRRQTQVNQRYISTAFICGLSSLNKRLLLLGRPEIKLSDLKI